jgi:hypothetical protein
LLKVDEVPIGKLDVVFSMRGGSLDYKINSMDNVTNFTPKDLTLQYQKIHTSLTRM